MFSDAHECRAWRWVNNLVPPAGIFGAPRAVFWPNDRLFIRHDTFKGPSSQLALVRVQLCRKSCTGNQMNARL